MIEAVGPETMGVTLDLANVVTRGEEPLAATRRVAPFVRQTHMRDWVLFRTPHGLERQIRACGDGQIDWPTTMGLLRDAGVRPNFTVENAHGDRNDIPLFDARWQTGQPDQAPDEIDALLRLAGEFAEDVRSGRRPDREAYDAAFAGTAGQEAFIARSAEALRAAATAMNYVTI
jgi:sugar phosphate isomerase/epimerase